MNTNCTFILVDACRGNPSFNTPTSLVVPPMSMIIASWTPDRNDAPCIEFVGPDANVKTGKCLVCSALILEYKSHT